MHNKQLYSLGICKPLFIFNIFSIEDVIDYYKEGLHTPFHSSLPLQSFWLGDVSSSETSLLLSGTPPGTFLLRLSSQWGYLAASFMDSDGRVKHTLIEQVKTIFKKRKLIRRRLREAVIDFRAKPSSFLEWTTLFIIIPPLCKFL